LKGINWPALEEILEEEGWPILWENWNRNQPRITQKWDKNSLFQHPNTPTSFNRGYKYKREREGDPSSFQK